MKSFLIDIEVALRIEKLVKNEPFEALTFNEALIRLLNLLEQKGHGKQNTPISPKKKRAKTRHAVYAVSGLQKFQNYQENVLSIHGQRYVNT